MRILVAGAGGVGSYFGGRLAEAGVAVTFFVREGRARQLEQHGLVVRSPHGDIRRRVDYVVPRELAQTYDLILLCCKAYQLEGIVAGLGPAVGPQTVVLPLLNGLRHLDYLDTHLPGASVIGGLCLIGVTLEPSGEAVQLDRLHALTFGERRPAQADACRAIAAVFQRARFDSRWSREVEQDLWEKWVMLTTLASATCLLRASIGEIMRTSSGESLVRTLLAEVRQVASASGHASRPAAAAIAEKLLTTPGSSTTASMLRDIERGALTEAQHVVGDMLARARASGASAPLLEVALCHLEAYEVRRSAGRA